MALTPSNMLPLGTPIPAFSLRDAVSGEMMPSDACFGEKGLVVMFICVHCPYVIHVQKELSRIAEKYASDGIGFVAISSNDIEAYPQDAPPFMKSQAESNGFSFPYLYDETQNIAKKFMAACTPDFFVFDRAQKCVYRGRMDDSTPGNGRPVTGADLRNALDALLSDRVVSEDQLPSMGCNIKWKSA